MSDTPECAYLSPVLTVADVLVAVFERAGIEQLFMIPGGPAMPALEAAYRSRRLRKVLVRHEGGGALMAEGYYRATGKLAALAVTAGPGTSNTVTSLALAQSERVPLILLAAQVSTGSYGRGAAQEFDAARLLEPVTKRVAVLSNPDRAIDVMDELIQAALSPRPGPVALIVPTDLFRRQVDPEKTRRALEQLRSPSNARLVDALQVEQLAAALARSERPMWISGWGDVQSGASAELLLLARRKPSMRFATTPRAKGVFPESHPQSDGIFGFAGHRAAEQSAFEHADLLIASGTGLGEISTAGWDPRISSVPLIQIDLDPSEPGRIFRTTLSVVGDSRTVLRGVLASPLLPPAAEPPRSRSPSPHPAVHERPFALATPIHPQRLMAALQSTFSERGHVFVDIGNSMAWCLHYLRRSQPGHWHVNLRFGAMGHAIPAAIGASLGTGDPVLAVLGDAAFLMSCNELNTAAQERLPLTVVVLNDGGHGMVEVGRKLLFADSPIPPMLFDPAPDVAGIARSLGVEAYTVVDPRELEATLEAAFARALPTVVDVRIDAEASPPIGSRTNTLLAEYSGRSRAAARGEQ